VVQAGESSAMAKPLPASASVAVAASAAADRIDNSKNALPPKIRFASIRPFWSIVPE
jgi:hypothetical protein